MPPSKIFFVLSNSTIYPVRPPCVVSTYMNAVLSATRFACCGLCVTMTIVNRFFRSWISSVILPVAIRTTGVEPLLLTTPEADLAAELDRQVAALAGSVEGTIGVIAAPSRLASLSRADSRAVRANAERIVFLSPLNAKGLEFDAVIVVGPDEIVAESPGGVRVLYVALTRPTQRLVTIDVGESAGAWRESLQ